MASIASYETKDGRKLWRVRYRKPNHASTDKSGFKTKRDAAAWMAANVTVAMATDTYVDPTKSHTTIGELSAAWLAKKKLTAKPSYYKTLEIAYGTHVEPRWGDVKIRDVNRSNIQHWVTELATGDGQDNPGKSASVVLRAYGILHGILEDAVADRRLPRNPCGRIELPRKGRKPHVYLTAPQLHALALHCPDRQHATLVLLLGMTGLRWGEAIGLTVGDVNLRTQRITVLRSATQVGSDFKVGTPKNGRTRSVVFPKLLTAALRREMHGKEPCDLLFPGVDGGYMRHVKTPTKKGNWFNAACRAAGIPSMTVHDLRHTAASLMVRSGANVKAVQNQLGHSSAAMTLDTYADLFDDDLDAVGRAMNDLLLKNVGFSWDFSRTA